MHFKVNRATVKVTSHDGIVTIKVTSDQSNACGEHRVNNWPTHPGAECCDAIPVEKYIETVRQHIMTAVKKCDETLFTREQLVASLRLHYPALGNI